jgi:hypothetical protein
VSKRGHFIVAVASICLILKVQLRPLLLSCFYVSLLTGLYFLGVRGVFLICTRNDRVGIVHGIFFTVLALVSSIQILRHLLLHARL